MKSGATTSASVVDGDAFVKGDNLSVLDRILRGGPLPKARPKRQRHQHNAGDDGLLVTTSRTAHAPTAVPQVGAGVQLVWHTNVQNAFPKNTGRMPVNAQRLRLHEASELGLATIARRGKAKVAARVAASLDHLHQRPVLLARFPASSASTTLMPCVRPTLLSRRLREVIALVARVLLK